MEVEFIPPVEDPALELFVVQNDAHIEDYGDALRRLSPDAAQHVKLVLELAEAAFDHLSQALHALAPRFLLRVSGMLVPTDVVDLAVTAAALCVQS